MVAATAAALSLKFPIELASNIVGIPFSFASTYYYRSLKQRRRRRRGVLCGSDGGSSIQLSSFWKFASVAL